MMTAAQILTLLAGNVGDLVDLNDWAVNTLREFCRAKGYDARALLVEETRRLDAYGLATIPAPNPDCTFDASDAEDLVGTGLTGYVRNVRRTGSHFMITRNIRHAIWATVVTRRALRT